MAARVPKRLPRIDAASSGGREPSLAARSAGLGSASTTALGTAYENATSEFLARPPFSIQRLLNVGGAGDGGVDLRGRWTWTRRALLQETSQGTQQLGPRGGLLDLFNGAIPCDRLLAGDPERSGARRETWDVLVQCKAERDRLGPAVVRELEGSILADLARRNRPHRARALAPPPPPMASVPGALVRDSAAATAAPIGVLVGLSGFSPAAIMHAQTSAVPLVLVHLRVDDLASMVAKRGKESTEGLSLLSASVNKALRRLVDAAFADETAPPCAPPA
ncbi:hypothetical protein JCM3774_000690 [Rhodotorula dairenensis]